MLSRIDGSARAAQRRAADGRVGRDDRDDRDPHTTGLAGAAAVHGYSTALRWGVAIFVLGFLLALVILPGPAKPRVPGVKAALARHAVGNCHHRDGADGARHMLALGRLDNPPELEPADD